MEVQDELKGIKALHGHLSPLRSFQEAHPVKETGQAYVAEIDIKCASTVVKLLGSKFPCDAASNAIHLRRFTKPELLPEYLRKRFPALENLQSQTIYVLIPPPAPDCSELENLLQPFAPAVTSPQSDTPNTPAEKKSAIRIEPIQVPLQPPTSYEQAQEWTANLWPSVYNAAARPASHSPPPVLLAKTKSSMEPHAGLYMSLARRVARDAHQSSRGRGVGVVVVDPALMADVTDAMAAVVAVAGDARYYVSEGKENEADVPKPSDQPLSSQPYNPDTEGRPDYHAMMRAASLISHKRLLARASSTSTDITTSTSQPPVLHPPPTPLESHFLSITPVLPPSSGGYLCTSFDVYSTHEPCVCCAMGMLLSRFRAVVIPAKKRQVHEQERRVDAALDAEAGYGLHWRAELNWRAVGFEFVEDVEAGREDEVGNGEDEAQFHP